MFIIKNPIPGFERHFGVTLPAGRTADDYLSSVMMTYADANSMLPPYESGLGGYEIRFENSKGSIEVVVEDVAIFYHKKD